MTSFAHFLEALTILRRRYFRTIAWFTFAAVGLWASPWGLMWIATPSIPLGLYATLALPPGKPLHRGDIVCYVPSQPQWAFERHYYVPGMHVCKPVAGIPGDIVEPTPTSLKWTERETGLSHSVNVLQYDSHQRPMPISAKALYVVAPEELLLVSDHALNSLDARYLGPNQRSEMTRQIYPLINF